MTDSMIERVANALYGADNPSGHSFEKADEWCQQHYRTAGRAAIEATPLAQMYSTIVGVNIALMRDDDPEAALSMVLELRQSIDPMFAALAEPNRGDAP